MLLLRPQWPSSRRPGEGGASVQSAFPRWSMGTILSGQRFMGRLRRFPQGNTKTMGKRPSADNTEALPSVIPTKGRDLHSPRFLLAVLVETMKFQLFAQVAAPSALFGAGRTAQQVCGLFRCSTVPPAVGPGLLFLALCTLKCTAVFLCLKFSCPLGILTRK